MRKSTLVGGLAAALTSMILVLPPPGASAAPGDTPGSIFSDLFIIQRTENGVPIPSDPFVEVSGTVTCVQPIAVVDGAYADIPGVDSTTNPVDGRTVDLVPLQGNTVADPAEDDTACLPQVGFEQYVAEADLERLNLARTSDEVIQRKLDEVEARLTAATEITLDGAGRITTDGVAIDASPEHAAMYQALMDTGTIPGLGVSPAQIDQGTGGFDEWMLAAAAIGTAGGKSVPIGPDTIEYYGRIAAPTGGVGDWGYIPVLAETFEGEEFIDYTGTPPEASTPGGFSYTRADVYTGCSIWLDVATLTWEYGPVLDRVEFLDIVPTPGTVGNVAGFTQMADDVRSVINYLHENEVVVNPDTGYGFYIDPVFEDSCTTPNEDLAPEGEPLSQAEMVAYLNDLVIEAEPPSVEITDGPADTTTATDATFVFDAGADSTRVLCILDGGAIEDCLSPTTYVGLEPGSHTFTVIAMGEGGIFASDTYSWTVEAVPFLVSLTPERLADTRPPFVAADSRFTATGPVAGGSMVEIPVAGRAGVPVDAEAAVVNLTIAGAATRGFATAFPCGTMPATSSINFQPGESIANELVAKLSPTGTVCVYVHRTAHVILDAAGYVPAESDYVSLTPERLADTRPPFVAADSRFTATGPVAGGSMVEIPVAGRAGVPVDAEAAVVNLTIAGAATRGFATAFPCGTMPATSSINFQPGESIANELVAKLSPTGTVCVYVHRTAHVILDAAGYVPAESDYVSLTPERLADTRPPFVAADSRFTATGPVAGGSMVEIPVAGRAGVPVDAEAAVVNLTIAGAATRGFATAFPCGTMPATSSINFQPGESIANELVAKLSPTGTVCVYVHRTAHVILDAAGYL